MLIHKKERRDDAIKRTDVGRDAVASASGADAADLSQLPATHEADPYAAQTHP